MLSVKNETGKSQKVRDKTYKVVNLSSRCASIISMDISMDLSMDIHIHGKPEYYAIVLRHRLGLLNNEMA